ncbi:MAG: type I DNA topoisomerase [Lachnospiraceae bacterium]|nr:type I DNA topoisomerase [Lachnospiraceae bacterium]
MAKNLLIVESPAKAKTIKKFLGSNYEVIASNGHVRDLPKSSVGVDVENDFQPKYITIRGKGELLSELRKAVKKADTVYLATDPDREGEAISWHLKEALKLGEGKKYKRITFNEITKNAVKGSIKQARDINMDLVDAQQARRIIDRFVGYEISPILWAKIKRGLSAGRVQSVALRLICDRENEINSFIPEAYYTLEIIAKSPDMKKPVLFRYAGTKDGKIGSRAELDTASKAIDGKELKITEIKEGQRTRKQPMPFTTSTLQQEASKKLGFATAKTMRIAQQLYEGVDIKGHGTVGLITYLRTDSVRVSDEAHAAAKSFIASNYGEDYVIDDKDIDTGKKKIQDAHEAIRPTYLDMRPVAIKDELSRDQFRLYQLIYSRFLASRMKPAVYATTSVKADCAGYPFRASASKLSFDGFMAAYSIEADEVDDNKTLAGLTEKSKLSVTEIKPEEHFTQPPAHFTEAALVKTLEELGIGRPSTYAPTISTIMNRHYIAKESKNLFVTELGEAVNAMMDKAFPVIIDVNFTANLESLFDQIEEGNIEWKTVVRNFYPDLHEAVMIAEKELESIEIKDEPAGETCELCGRDMVIKYGPHGKFIACPGFPECRNTKPYFERIGVKCPDCGGDVVIKMTKKGRRYYGCLSYPECEFMSWAKPVEEKCPKCGGYMVEKGNKLMCQNEECKNVIAKPKD